MKYKKELLELNDIKIEIVELRIKIGLDRLRAAVYHYELLYAHLYTPDMTEEDILYLIFKGKVVRNTLEDLVGRKRLLKD